MMSLNEYQQFLNDFYSRYNFETVDVNLLIIAKELTENLSIFGNYDDVTRKRLDYFSNKIKSLSYNNMQSSTGGGIPNNNIGAFYDPKKSKNVPGLVNLTFQLPIRRNDPNYPNLKAIIEDLIENATQELDYHKVDMARKNLEAVAYYLSHIID